MRNAADEGLQALSSHSEFGVNSVLNSLTRTVAAPGAKNKLAGNKLTIGKYSVLDKILKNNDFQPDM
jgi:hypothetical protein